MITITKVGSLVKIDGLEGKNNIYEYAANLEDVRLSEDETQLYLRIGGSTINYKPLSGISIGGTVPTNAATVQSALATVFPSAAPATALPTEYPATYAAMQTSITADPTTKRDFFVTADETNGGVATQYSYNGTRAIQITNLVFNVKDFGAKGDGTTDDTTAVNAALAAGVYVYVPSGTYICSNLTVQNNQKIIGNGTIKFKTGSTGYLIEAGSNVINIDGITFDGGNIVDYSGTSSAGTRSCLHISAATNRTRITNVSISGFDNVAIGFNGNTTSSYEAPIILGCSISKNYKAIDTGVGASNGGEYLKILGNSMNQNRYALMVNSGNANIVGNTITNNGYGIYIKGDVTNGSHGNFSGNLCNHSGVYAVYCISVSLGFTMSGNQFFYGDWYIRACFGMNISNNSIAATNMTFSSSGWNNFTSNWFYLNTTITGNSQNSIWMNNYNKTSGNYIGSKSSLPVDNSATTYTPVVTGSEAVSNGTFSSDTVWTKGAGWTIAGGVAHGANTSGLLYQNTSIPSANDYYSVTITISNYVGGSLQISIGNGTPDTYSSSISGNGTFTLNVYNAGITGTFYIVASGFTGDIDNVSCKQISSFTSNIISSFNGTFKATQFGVADMNTAPASATDTGTKGEIRITSGYIYVCTATNTWVRSALTTW